MDSILITNWKTQTNDFGYSLQQLLCDPLIDDYTHNPYLYFSWELENICTRREYWKAYGRKQIRRCVIRNGKFYDFMVKRDFNSLEEWATDSNHDVSSIVYGTYHMRRGYKAVYVKLKTLINFIKNDVFLYLLNSNVIGLYTNKCIVVYNDIPTICSVYDRFYNGEYTTSIVYEGNQYFRKSDLPYNTHLFLPC